MSAIPLASLQDACLVAVISSQPVPSALTAKLVLHLSHLVLSSTQVKQLVGQATVQSAAAAALVNPAPSHLVSTDATSFHPFLAAVHKAAVAPVPAPHPSIRAVQVSAAGGVPTVLKNPD